MPWSVGIALALLASCGGGDGGGSVPTVPGGPTPTPTATPAPTPTPTPTPGATTTAVTRTVVATFDAPWAMTFLPDGRMLVTEKAGKLQLATQAGAKTEITGVPPVVYSGQIGFLDVILDPDFATNNRIYLTYEEAAAGGQRLAVARATLNIAAARLDGLSVIWRVTPTTTGGQPGGRLAFSPDHRYLFVSTGERQQGAPAQDKNGTLGKIVRIFPDGTIPTDNPFANTAGYKPEIWTLGHRNPYGLAFDASGRLWEHEMGPMGGDELNLIEPGKNYGWPNVSNGDNYDGTPIPDHKPGDGYQAPAISWSPVIAPAGLIFYSGSLFQGWQGQAIIGGLVSQGIVRVRIDGVTGTEVQRISLGARIREVEQGSDGAIWVLEDAPTGRLVKLTPAN